MPAAPGKPAEKISKPKAPEDKESALPASATIVVSLPAAAKLMVDDVATTSTSSSRTFVSPELEAGKEFSYTLTAQIINEGTPVALTKVVTVRAGVETRVSFDFSVASVASK